MTTIDRYLVALFVKVLLVCFISLAGLYVVIDAVNNSDELLAYGRKQEGGVGLVLLEYYGPRVLQFFDKTVGVLALIGVMFAVAMLQRSNELTALMAAGIAPARVILPLLIAAGVVSGLGVVNREVGLPQVRDSLSRNAQDWQGENARKCTPKYDIQTDILISGKGTRGKDRRIDEPQFRLPPEIATWGRQIVAAAAFQQAATADHPAGYLLRGVKQPVNLGQLPSHRLGERMVLYSPSDTPWLAAGECFVVSMVGFDQLTVGNGWRQNLSTYELITGLANRTIEPGADVYVTLHSRLVQPLLDLSLVLLGLPLVLTRGNRNIFVAATLCVVLTAVVYLVIFTCHGLGANYLLKPPLLAAWIPLVVFGPLAYAWARPLWD